MYTKSVQVISFLPRFSYSLNGRTSCNKPCQETHEKAPIFMVSLQSSASNFPFKLNSQNTIQITDLPHLPDHRQHGLHQQSPKPSNRTCGIPFNLPQDHHHPLTPTSIIRQGDTTAALSQQQMFLIGQLRGLAHEFALNHIWAYSGESLKTCDMLMILLQMIVIMVMVVTMELIFPHRAPLLLGGQRTRSCAELGRIAKIRVMRNRCDSLCKRG